MIDLLRALWALVPFLTEMMFPGKTTKEVIRQNKYSSFVTIIVIFSLSFNWIMLKRVYAIAMEQKYQHVGILVSNPTAASAASAVASTPSASAPVLNQEDIDKKARDEIRDRLNILFGVPHP